MWEWLLSLFRTKEPEPVVTPETPGKERPSPAGVIPFSDLHLSSDRNVMTLNKSGLVFGSLMDTNSMDPLFDANHTLIMTDDFDRDALVVGDIISYHVGSGQYIVHRIDEIIVDDYGRLYHLLGDNNAGQRDSYRVRNEHITYLIVGIIYTKDLGV